MNCPRQSRIPNIRTERRLKAVARGAGRLDDVAEEQKVLRDAQIIDDPVREAEHRRRRVARLLPLQPG